MGQQFTSVTETLEKASVVSKSVKSKKAPGNLKTVEKELSELRSLLKDKLQRSKTLLESINCI